MDKILGEIVDGVYYTPEYTKVERKVNRTWVYIVRCYDKHSVLVPIDSELFAKNNVFFVYNCLSVKLFIYTRNNNNGKETDILTKTFKTGVNIGKKSETTALTQAIKVADSKYNAKAKYSESFKPMLASISSKLETLDFTGASVQYKLNGVRLLVHVVDGSVVLMHSRGGRVVTGLSLDITTEIEDLNLPKGEYVLDGELYTHGEPLNKINGRLGRQDYTGGIIDKFNIFDIYHTGEPDLSYDERSKILDSLEFQDKHHIRRIETIRVSSYAEAHEVYKKAIDEEYEGVIIRLQPCVYIQNFRSDNVFKLKPVYDDMFKLVNFTSSTTGNHDGAVLFMCETVYGKKFTVNISDASIEQRKKLYTLFVNTNAFNEFMNTSISVRYMSISKSGIPLQTVCKLPANMLKLLK